MRTGCVAWRRRPSRWSGPAAGIAGLARLRGLAGLGPDGRVGDGGAVGDGGQVGNSGGAGAAGELDTGEVGSARGTRPAPGPGGVARNERRAVGVALAAWLVVSVWVGPAIASAVNRVPVGDVRDDGQAREPARTQEPAPDPTAARRGALETLERAGSARYVVFVDERFAGIRQSRLRSTLDETAGARSPDRHSGAERDRPSDGLASDSDGVPIDGAHFEWLESSAAADGTPGPRTQTRLAGLPDLDLLRWVESRPVRGALDTLRVDFERTAGTPGARMRGRTKSRAILRPLRHEAACDATLRLWAGLLAIEPIGSARRFSSYDPFEELARPDLELVRVEAMPLPVVPGAPSEAANEAGESGGANVGAGREGRGNGASALARVERERLAARSVAPACVELRSDGRVVGRYWASAEGELLALEERVDRRRWRRAFRLPAEGDPEER